jgi:hypothetical protein
VSSVCNTLLFAAENLPAGAYSGLRICSGQESGTGTVESWIQELHWNITEFSKG